MGFVEVSFGRNKPRTCSETLGTAASGFYLAAGKIFLSNALGKQMSEAEIQIVFANGNRLPKNAQTAIHCEGNSSLSWEMSELQSLGLQLLRTAAPHSVFCCRFFGGEGN